MAESVQEEHQQNGIMAPEPAPTHSAPPSAKHRRPSVDRDAQEMVIESLRTQIQDLISQVSELNNKLVKSYDRVSDLEDDLHVASANSRSSSLKISQLELERTQHLAALNTGLLVEKSHVTSELTRLMEKATEEAAQRGQAESARHAIEKDLDDLSASLFGQANTMVAEARFEKHLSERKVEDAQRALKSAEEVVQLMQTQMQRLQADKENAEKKTQAMELAMGKGKWVPTRDSDAALSLRLLSAHSPYQEYMAFIAHLRVLHPTSPQQSPAMSTLLQLPFLTRLLTEDSEPTVRLDLAPSLNWLSRRSVLTAIHSGQLMIEPMLASTLFAESSTYPTSTTIAGVNSTNDNISCALCGVSIFATTDSSQHKRPSVLPLSSTTHSHSTSWSGAFFKKTGSIGYTNGPPSPIRNSIGAHLNSQVFIFRLASPPTSAIASLPLPSLTKPTTQSFSSPIPSSYSSPISNGSPQNGTPANNQPTTIYPLCMSGWCLNRLRSTCTLWAFVRTGIVEKVWEEELAPPPPPPLPPTATQVEKGGVGGGEKPPIPPRKRGIWGIASAIGEKAASWSENDKDKAKKSTLPPEPRRVPPPLPPLHSSKPSPIPPPLPKRHERREKTPVHSPPPPTTTTTTTEDTNTTTTTEYTSATDATTSSPTTPATTTDSTLPPIPLSPIRGTHLRSSSTGGVDAVAVHPARTSTPASIPLPDSRPATPAAPPFAGTAAVPSRTTSPAIAIPPSGPPPPIPRRAAARTRVAGVSRPVTPANATAPAPAADPAPVMENAAATPEVTAEAKDQDTAPVKESDDAVINVPGKKAAEEAAVKATDDDEGVGSSEKLAADNKETNELSGSPIAQPSSRASPESELYVDAPTPGEPVAEEENSEEEQEKNRKKEDDEDDDEDDKHTFVDVAEKNKSNLNGILTEDPVHVHVNGLQAEEEEEEEGRQQQQQHDDDDEHEGRTKREEEKMRIPYVGDATWEEKTWKEIVRLREDMFWARIGGIRE